MTAIDATNARTGRSLLPIAVAAAVAALLLMLIGTYLDTPYKTKGSGEWGLSTQDLNQLPLLVAFAAVGAAVVFGVVVARGLRTAPEPTARRSLIVASVGVVSIAAFWTGLQVILAAGATTLALDARRRLGRLPGTAIAALVLAALITVAAVWLPSLAKRPRPGAALKPRSDQPSPRQDNPSCPARKEALCADDS